MTLVDQERRFVRVCFAREPQTSDLDALGGIRDRWLLYRHMVRERMRKMIANALSRTTSALGEEQFGRSFDGWLDEAPPRTRYIREIVPAFVAHGLPAWREDPEVPDWTADLAAFEATRWEIASLDAPAPDAGELAFEKTAVANPTARILRVRYPVHRPSDAYEREPTLLCLYRRADDKTVAWAVDDFTALLVESFARGDATITDHVKAAANELRLAVDEDLVRRVGTTLADLVQRGIVLGAR